MIAPASRKLGKYEILHKLGRGGMGDVYLALDTEFNSRVALKLIEHADDPDTQDSIEAERRGTVLQAHLAHIDPRVVRIYDSGDLEGYFFVSMEYIEGRDLAELMRRGPLPPEFATDVALAVAQTLENAHHLQVTVDGREIHGMVHGDIKPKNIRIDSHGEVRVIDFGIAKALSMSRRLTRNEFGSVPYGSPERLEAGQVNELSDLWSLAVMLYEMVTGVQPYHAESTEILERMIRSRVPPPPAPPPCPEPLRRILVKAMAPDAAQRYQSAADLAAELRRFRAGEPVEAAVSGDMDATRRTYHPGDPADGDETRRTSGDDTRRTTEEETRRTQARVVFSSQPKEATWPPKAPVSKRARIARRVAGGVGIFLAAAILWSFTSNVLLYRRGQQLEKEIAAEQLTDPNQIWDRWTELSHSNPSSMLLRGPRQAVRQKLVASADRVIASYRNSDAVYENTWKGARDQLARALTLQPDDSVRGRLRLTEGHIARINGTSHRSAPELNEAVAKFSEAARLLPQSPDPELGLARVYVTGLKDIDRAYQALLEAEKRGFELGNRERSQLADGYRERGDRLFWDSRNVRGLPQEKEQIERSRDDYERALGLYQSIAPASNASAQIIRVQASLDQANSRLRQIELGIDGPEPQKSGHGIPSIVKSLVRHLWRSREAKH